MQSLQIKFLKYITILLVIFLFLIVLYITHFMSNVLVPVFFAFFTATLLQPFINQLRRTKLPNWFAIFIVYSSFLLIISILLTIIWISFSSFISDLPEIMAKFNNKIAELTKNIYKMPFLKLIFGSKKFGNNIITNILNESITVENFTDYILRPIGITFDVLKSFGLYALSLIFIIPGMGRISNKISKAFPDHKGIIIIKMIDNITLQLQNYMLAKSIIGFGVGILTFLICLAFNIKYALLWGALMFLFYYIPYIGAIIAMLFPMILSIIQYQSAIHFITLTLSLIAIHILMGNIIEPKFMSKGVNLSPIIIFTSLLVWGFVWGAGGVLLSVPIMSVLNLVFSNIKPLKPISYLISANKEEKKNSKKSK